MSARIPTAFSCQTRSCVDFGVLTPKGWCEKSGSDVLCRECHHPMRKERLGDAQKRAIEGYEYALRQEDRYLGSVFVNRHGQEKIEAKTKAAHDLAKRLGVDRWC